MKQLGYLTFCQIFEAIEEL